MPGPDLYHRYQIDNNESENPTAMPSKYDKVAAVVSAVQDKIKRQVNKEYHRRQLQHSDAGLSALKKKIYKKSKGLKVPRLQKTAAPTGWGYSAPLDRATFARRIQPTGWGYSAPLNRDAMYAKAGLGGADELIGMAPKQHPLMARLQPRTQPRPQQRPQLQPQRFAQTAPASTAQPQFDLNRLPKMSLSQLTGGGLPAGWSAPAATPAAVAQKTPFMLNKTSSLIKEAVRASFFKNA